MLILACGLLLYMARGVCVCAPACQYLCKSHTPADQLTVQSLHVPALKNLIHLIRELCSRCTLQSWKACLPTPPSNCCRISVGG